MDSIMVVLGLCAVATAMVNSPKSHPIRPVSNSQKDVFQPQSNPQNLYPSIGQSHPLGPIHLGMYAMPMDAQDFGPLPTVSILNPLGNNVVQNYDSSLGFYSSTVQNDQPIIGYQGPDLLYPEPNDVLSSLIGYPGIGQLPSILPSPYELKQQQYISLRQGSDILVPEWISMENKIQNAVNVLRINMVDPESETVVRWWDTQAEYTLLLGVIYELMEQVALHGPQSYDDIFTKTVLVSLAKIRMNLTPKELAQQLVYALKEAHRASAYIRGVIDVMVHSAFCQNPVLCNEYIDILLMSTTNKRLQDEKKVLLAAADLANIFLDYYAEEFVITAKKSMAYIYFGDLLRRGDLNELKPLVLTGAMLINQVKERESKTAIDVDVFLNTP